MVFAEKVFSVPNCEGAIMHGIIHFPASPNGAFIIMCNIGLHYRTCHARLFVRHARSLQESGYTVVRFDTSKVGYSEGEMVVKRAIDAYDSIQTGLFSKDLSVVINYIEEHFKPRKLFLYGLCGGALTALITAAQTQNVVGVIFIAGPVTITNPVNEVSGLHTFYAIMRLKGYMRKLLSVKAWLRFLGGKSSYRLIYRSIFVKIHDIFKRFIPNTDLDSNSVSVSEGNKGILFNFIFYDSFVQMIDSGRKILFVLPELDHATFDFDRIFSSKVSSLPTGQKHLVEIVKVPRANHTFSSEGSFENLLSVVEEWLNSIV